jgi:hypothetical protein
VSLANYRRTARLDASPKDGLPRQLDPKYVPLANGRTLYYGQFIVMGSMAECGECQ